MEQGDVCMVLDGYGMGMDVGRLMRQWYKKGLRRYSAFVERVFFIIKDRMDVKLYCSYVVRLERSHNDWLTLLGTASANCRYAASAWLDINKADKLTTNRPSWQDLNSRSV